MNITIRIIEKKDYQRAHAFQCEYLDQETLDAFVSRVEANPVFYLAAFDGGELVGVCYGHPSARVESAVNLQGIAVSLEEGKNYARIGIGSRLLEDFQEVVIRKGYSIIGVGAADDLRVENFYLKNGFKPYELVAKGYNYEEYERVRISDYESAMVMKRELFSKYNPREVIFIFQKNI
jgi:GNAT superfamily N-acetyltransferase